MLGILNHCELLTKEYKTVVISIGLVILIVNWLSDPQAWLVGSLVEKVGLIICKIW